MDILRGTVVSGEGDYALWIEKYQSDYQRITSMILFPGTLNIRLDGPYEFPAQKITRLEKGAYPGSVSISIVPARILGRAAWILRPDLPASATLTDAAQRLATLEVATDIKLRDTYHLRDGDEIEVEIP